MRIESIQVDPVCEIPFLNAGRRAGGHYVDQLPVHLGDVSGLPESVAALVVTADLQGRERLDKKALRPPRLLGETLPHILKTEILPEMEIREGRIGVLLAGDFYTVPALDKRGGSGDVTQVWWAFAGEFDWVAGVAGNHDTFGSKPNRRPQFHSQRIHFLDGDRKVADGLKLAGLSGIIGNPSRAWRRTEEEYCHALEQLLTSDTDIVIMHDGPNAPAERFRGSDSVRQVIEMLQPRLVVRGHSHWAKPLVELDNKVQVLNVDARVVVLRALGG